MFYDEIEQDTTGVLPVEEVDGDTETSDEAPVEEGSEDVA